jgi:hypothetical protein
VKKSNSSVKKRSSSVKKSTFFSAEITFSHAGITFFHAAPSSMKKRLLFTLASMKKSRFGKEK